MNVNLEKPQEEKKSIIMSLLTSIDNLFKQSILSFIIIGVLSHYKLIKNYTFLINRLNDKIYKTDEEQLFSIGDNCSKVIWRFLVFINWGYVSMTFMLIISLFIFSNTLLYYFPKFLLHRFMCLFYICLMCMNVISVFPIFFYILSPGFLAVLYYIIRLKEHESEESVKISIQELFIFHTKEYFILFSMMIFFSIPFVISMLYFLYNLLLSLLLFNNKANISNLSNLILSFIIMKIITCFVKYFITFMQHQYVKEKCFNWNSFKLSFIKAISKTNEYCFFLILCKLLTDVVLRVLLLDSLFGVKFKPLLYIFLIILSLIQIATSIHKSMCMSIAVIWGEFPEVFELNNPNSKRRFYTGRNVMFYFRTIRKDLFSKILWNIESRVALFHGALLNIFYFILTRFFKNFENKLIKSPAYYHFAVSNIPDKIFKNELCISFKRNVVRFFLISPYLFLLISTQTALISSFIFKGWYLNIKDS